MYEQEGNGGPQIHSELIGGPTERVASLMGKRDHLMVTKGQACVCVCVPICVGACVCAQLCIWCVALLYVQYT